MNLKGMTLLERYAANAEESSRIRAELEARAKPEGDPQQITADRGRRTKRTGIYSGDARRMSTQELLVFMKGEAQYENLY